MVVIDKELVINIEYNINPNEQDILKLIRIQHEFLNKDYTKLILNFTECTFINAAVSVVIGTLCVYANQVNKSVQFKFKDKENNPIFKFMKKVGMYEYFIKDENMATKDAIPFNRISNEDIMETYTNRIMELAPINLEEEAKDVLSSYFFEIYQNALYHSESPIDVFSCGYWMPTKKELIFSIYDMGIGIPNNVREHLKEQKSSRECIEWAFTEGKSTIEDELVKRGLGLSRLETFIKLNKGIMSVYTDDICVIINEEGRNTIELDAPIKGTLIIINIKADTEHTYIVK